jgi:hypothetical protein
MPVLTAIIKSNVVKERFCVQSAKLSYYFPFFSSWCRHLIRKLTLVSILSFSIRIRCTKAVPRTNRFGRFSLAVVSVLLSSSSSLGTQRQVHPWRRSKAKRDTHRLQVQVVNIENVSVRMARIGQNITSIGIAGGSIQVVILFNQPLKLALDVGHLACGEFVLVQRHLGSFEIAQEASFFGGQEEKSPTRAFGSTSCTTDSL